MLDPVRHRLTGHETIVYRSGADSALPSIYLHAYPNAFRDHHTIYAREGERWGEDYAVRFAASRDRGWMTIDSVTVGGKPAAIELDETIARIDLPRPLLPRDSVIVRLRFAVQVPRPFNRLGHAGDNYSMGQWYPKVVVHDDRGWHPDPYHYFAEFYGDYGTFDVAITLPDRFWVGATGVFRGATGGDNEIPLADGETGDSVSVRLLAVPADSLRNRWPRTMLAVESDLSERDDKSAAPLQMKQGTPLVLRVPRAAPVHYSYSWVESKRETRREADAAGRPGPLRLILASRDTSIVDSIRALAAPQAPGDSALPSLKTVRFHAERVHDFAWVASPEYVRADTVWNRIQIRALAYREDQDLWADQRATVVSVMKFMTREVGPYVWPSFTSAESYLGGGAMEYPMLIMNEPDLPSDWVEMLDVTIAHELAHNWFYGMLGSDERAFPWLDEGFTQYMENRYSDWKYPNGLLKRRKLLPWTSPLRDLFLDENRYLNHVAVRDEQPIDTPAERYLGGGPYAVGAYSKPAMMLRTLHGILGEARFRAFLGEYYRSNLLRHPRPEDVVAAANRSTGLDLSSWFATWLGRTGLPSYSIRDVERDRIEGERVATVRVRCKGDCIEPVKLQATFADGARETRTLDVKSGGAQPTFGGQSRLAKAVLDPDHDIVEWSRLDNQNGFPPLRFKPLLDFPSSEAMTFVYGPMIWHGRAEGVRLGAWTSGRYLASSDFPDGVVGAGGSAIVGTRRGDFSVGGWTSRRVGALGARSRVGLEAWRDAGLFRAGLSAGNLVTEPGRRRPWRAWSLSLDYRDRYDLAPVDPRYWSPGRTLQGKARVALDTQGPRRAEHLELDLRGGGHTERLSVEARQRVDFLERANAHLRWRIFAGSAFDRPPRELLFDVAEGSRVDSVGRFYLNDRGPLLRSGHYWIAGGGGLRGYRGRAALGKRVCGLNLDLDLPMLPVSLFGDVGRVESIRHTLGDAGLGYSLGPVRITAPLWVGRPQADEGPWHARWLISLESLQISF